MPSYADAKKRIKNFCKKQLKNNDEKAKILKVRQMNFGKYYLCLTIIMFGCSTSKEHKTQLFKFSCPSSTEVRHLPKSNFEGIFIFSDIDTGYYHFGYSISTLTEKIAELIILPDVSDDEIKEIINNNHDLNIFLILKTWMLIG